MPYFLRIDPSDTPPPQAWEITETEAIRIGVANPRQNPGCYFQANDGEDIFTAIKRNANGWFGSNGESPFHKTSLAPGQYYPRMARPIYQHPSDSPGFCPGMKEDQEIILKTRSQVTLLARLLSEILQTVHASDENMGAYGNDIRNLLLLAAMEAEAQWKGILRANGVKGTSTTDYIKLASPMRLREYTVAMTEYPWLSPIQPFADWKEAEASKSLDWYGAYNATKHDRESSFSEATLGRAVAAVCGNVALLAAQYGIPFGLGQRTRLAEEFRIGAPSWAPGEVYIYPYGQVPDWQATKYPF